MQFKSFEVEVLRGSKVESQHTVVASVFARDEKQMASFGDDHRLVFPRSCIKPIQAMPLILTSAAKHFQLGNEELALSCASHRGEDFHIKILRNWMSNVGISENDLECGTHPPTNTDSLYQLLRSQNLPTPIYNNCSGKHIGMITTSIYLNEPIKNYVSLQHPVQKRINHYIETFCHVSLNANTFSIDGCSIPTPAIPLKNLAEGFCEFSDPIRLTSIESDACQKLFSACVTHPLLTAGTGHYCSEAMKETKGQVLIKGGAEGVLAGTIPKLKLGFAVKTIDGNSRATEFCTSLLLNRFGLLPNSSDLLQPKIYNWNQIETGFIRLADH